ncbi:MAG: 3-hydroxybutyrate oligomer hydrolase family protein, partial [Pseudomonadota bacterium]
LLQPCAALAAEAAGAPLLSNIAPATAAARCATLQANGFVSGGNTALQASSALNLLQSMGYQPESNLLHASMYALATPAIVMTYANAYGRFSVADNLCGFSFSGTGDQLPTSFGRGNGIPPMVGINIFNNNSVGGAVPDSVSISPSSGVMDYNFDGALCQRKLAVVLTENALRVQNGMGEVTRSANLHGKPALIVHGRADTLIPVAFSSRPYFGVNRMVEGVESKLSYIEVTNAQHFDSFLPIAGFDARFVPLHHYFNQAMDLMYAHLKAGAALPVSQLVRTTPRGVDAAGKANPISLGNLPPIKMTVAEADAITFSRNVVRIPD